MIIRFSLTVGGYQDAIKFLEERNLKIAKRTDLVALLRYANEKWNELSERRTG